MACVFALMNERRISLREATVIDIGCFTGKHAAMYAEAGAAHVLAIDAKEVNIQQCRQLYNLPNLEFIRSDCRNLPDQTFSWIHAFGILYHLDDPTSLLKEIFRVMSNEAWALVDTHVGISGVQWPGEKFFLMDNCVTQRSFDSVPYDGKVFIEFPSTLPEGARPRRAAYDNPESFWFTADSLEKAFRTVGFSYERVFAHDRFDFWRDDTRRQTEGRTVPYARVAYLLQRER